MAKPAKDPKAEAEFQAALKLFQQGKLAEAEKEFARIAKNRKGTPWGEDWPVLPRRDPVPAEEVRPRPRQLRDAAQGLSGDRLPGKLVSREYAIAQLWCIRMTPRPPRTSGFPGTAASTAASP